MKHESGVSGFGPAWLASRISGRTALDIGAAVVQLVHSGELPAGARLPTVRELAPLLQVSSVTLVAAWAELRRQGVIQTRRRGGTTVLEQAGSRGLGGQDRAIVLDMSQSIARAELQPDLGAALLAGLKVAALHRPERDYIIADLREAVAPTWPFVPEAWTTVAGGAEATFCVIAATLGPTRHVAMEHPASPTAIEAAAQLGARIFPVPWDEDGPRPDALRAAIAAGVESFVFQPCAHVPTGRGLGKGRRDELAAVLRDHPAIAVAEIDTAGPLANRAVISLGALLPGRVLHARAYCRTYGIDLKTAIVGGSAALIRKLIELRCHGYSVTSRILQGALAWLLTDRASLRRVAAARDYYAARRKALAEALRDRGTPCEAEDGLFVWIPVRQETAALNLLAARGIEAAGSMRSRIGDTPLSPHIRLAITGLPEDARFLAALADVVQQAVLVTTELD